MSAGAVMTVWTANRKACVRLSAMALPEEAVAKGWAPDGPAKHGRNMGETWAKHGISHDTVGITIINHPFGNGSYLLSMVIWGMV